MSVCCSLLLWFNFHTDYWCSCLWCSRYVGVIVVRYTCLTCLHVPRHASSSLSLSMYHTVVCAYCVESSCCWSVFVLDAPPSWIRWCDLAGWAPSHSSILFLVLPRYIILFTFCHRSWLFWFHLCFLCDYGGRCSWLTFFCFFRLHLLLPEPPCYLLFVFLVPSC